MGRFRKRSQDDEDLIIGLAGGDEASFDQFYSRHLPAVTGYFLRRVADRELAFDLTAETFAAAIESSGRFDRAVGNGMSWLFAIAHNKLVSTYRRGRVESEARARLQFEPVALLDEDLDRVTDLASASEERALEIALAALPAELRDAILSRVVGERPYAEIAADMACSEAVVRQRVSRGLRDLRTRLERVE